MDTREPDLQMVSEQHYEMGMTLVDAKNWHELKSFLNFTDDVTAEAILESMNANDMHDYTEATDPAPHDSIIDEIGV